MKAHLPNMRTFVTVRKAWDRGFPKAIVCFTLALICDVSIDRDDKDTTKMRSYEYKLEIYHVFNNFLQFIKKNTIILK